MVKHISKYLLSLVISNYEWNANNESCWFFKDKAKEIRRHASDRCAEGHGFDSRRGLRFGSLSCQTEMTSFSSQENAFHL